MKKSEKEKINIISETKIKFFRREKGIISEVLAEKIGMGSRTYFNKAKGKTEFTATETWMLTNMLSCSLDDLIKDECEMNDSEKVKFKEILSKESLPVDLGNDMCEYDDIDIYEPLGYTWEELKKLVRDSKDFKFNIISGKKIKHFMNINKITVDEISYELGKQRRTIFNKIKGETEFTATELWILTKLFGCTVDDLIKDIETV